MRRLDRVELSRRFGANTYLDITRAIDLYDAIEARGRLAQVAAHLGRFLSEVAWARPALSPQAPTRSSSVVFRAWT